MTLLQKLTPIIRSFEADAQANIQKLENEIQELRTQLSIHQPESQIKEPWTLIYETDNGEGAPIEHSLGVYESKAEAGKALLRARSKAQKRGVPHQNIVLEKIMLLFAPKTGDTLYTAYGTEDCYGEPSGGPLGTFGTREEAQTQLDKCQKKFNAGREGRDGHLDTWIESVTVGDDNFDPFE